MDNKNIKSVIAVGVIILLVVIGICIFVNGTYTDETVPGQTETQITEASPEPEVYGEISTEQIEAGAVEGRLMPPSPWESLWISWPAMKSF